MAGLARGHAGDGQPPPRLGVFRLTPPTPCSVSPVPARTEPRPGDLGCDRVRGGTHAPPSRPPAGLTLGSLLGVAEEPRRRLSAVGDTQHPRWGGVLFFCCCPPGVVGLGGEGAEGTRSVWGDVTRGRVHAWGISGVGCPRGSGSGGSRCGVPFSRVIGGGAGLRAGGSHGAGGASAGGGTLCPPSPGLVPHRFAHAHGHAATRVRRVDHTGVHRGSWRHPHARTRM